MNAPPTSPKPWSVWALVGLAFSVGLCPVITMLGVVCGLMGLRDVRLHQRRGRRVAIAAIIIGLVVTPATTFALVWWNDAIRTPLLHGPQEALLAGQGGSPAALLEAFPTDAASGSEAATFLRAMGDRFGTLVSISQDAGRDAMWSPDGGSISVPYVFTFSRESVPGAARYVILDRGGQGPALVLRFAWVRIGDTSPLVFPPGADTGDHTEDDDAN
ncbi:MAG: DUF4190 domain-containing protein [Phycisphaerales bacterium]|nr:DUF4190 domain-containing protein [Phycisphaerales bacterium]